MSLGEEERLAVLRMVAAGKVAPEEGLDLLAALAPEPMPARGAKEHGDELLRVRFSDPPQQLDFTVRVSATQALAAVLCEVLTMLPEQAGRMVPPGLLRGLDSVPVGQAPDDTLVRIQDAPQELTVRRLRTEGTSPAPGFRGNLRKGGDIFGKHIEFGW